MTESIVWGAYVRDTITRYIRHYLTYAESHDHATAVDYDDLEAEQFNVLAAMDRTYQDRQWVQVRRFAWALCKPYSGYLGVRGYWSELRTRLEQAVRASEAVRHDYDARTFAMNRATVLLDMGMVNEAEREFKRVLQLQRAAYDRHNEVVTLNQLGILAQSTGDFAEARRLCRRSLDINEELGDQEGIARTLHQLGMLVQATGDHTEAHRLYKQSLDIFEELGNRTSIAISLHQLGSLAQATRDYAEARRLCQQSLAISKELGDRVGVASALHQLGVVAQATGDYAEARHLYRQSLDISEELGVRTGIATTLGQLANLAKAEGNLTEAERLYRQSWAIAEEIGDVVRVSIQMFNLATQVFVRQGRLAKALPLIEQAVEIAERTGFYEADRWRAVLERLQGRMKLWS